MVLELLKNDTENNTVDYLYTCINPTDMYSLIISREEIKRIMIKLLSDNFTYESSTEAFVLTFEGLFFIENGGYEAKSLSDAYDAEEQRLEIARLRNLDEQSGLNQTRLNVLTYWLVVGTIGATIVALLILGWQVWIYFHPQTTGIK